MAAPKNLALTGVLGGAIAVGLSPAWAHHSHVMFDHDKEITISGTCLMGVP